jgi:chitin disaccharide deacetylase
MTTPSALSTQHAALSIVVTADDFGFGLPTSRGIICSHLYGPVTATSLMVLTGEHARQSIPLLADAPKLEVGLHLTLTDCGHGPLTPQYKSGLVRRDGRFHSLHSLLLRAAAGRIDHHAAMDEICAQAMLFEKLVGRSPAYIDGHHHVHQFPVIRNALAEVIELGILPAITRSTKLPAPWRAGRMRGMILNRTATASQNIFRKNKIWSNDHFIGLLSPADLQKPFPWDAMLATLPSSGVVEWMVHPGELDDSIPARDSYYVQRVTELKALTDPTMAHHWEKFRPHLKTKSECAEISIRHPERSEGSMPQES